MVSAWHSFETWLQSIKLNDHYKLILAFNEYKKLHYLLQTHPLKTVQYFDTVKK